MIGLRAGSDAQWKRVRVAEIAQRTATGPFGSAISAKHFCDSGVPVIPGSNLSQDTSTRLVDDGLTFVSEDKAREFARSEARPGDLVFTCWGTIDQVGLIDHRAKFRRYIVSNKQMLLTPDSSRADSLFLYYTFSSPENRAAILNQGIGSSVPGFNLGQLRSFEIALPPLAEQKAIAAVLGALDDKIELNRRMNATLEAMARTLFQTWFVDFDPVRAKLDGRKPDGLDKATAALFPAAFQDSALGPIPKGWISMPLYDLATYVNGAAYTAFQPNGEGRGLPIIKIAELKAGVTDQYSDVQMPEKYRLRTGDILFSWSGNPDTSIDTFVWSHGAAWLNQHIVRVDPHRDGERSFVLATPKHLRPVFAEIARNKQTTGLGHVTASDMQRLLVVKPDAGVLAAWDHQANPLFEAIFRNTLEAQTLAALRDTLLPKLLSGEISPSGPAFVKQMRHPREILA